jgi:hypothetical protein
MEALPITGYIFSMLKMHVWRLNTSKFSKGDTPVTGGAIPPEPTATDALRR